MLRVRNLKPRLGLTAVQAVTSLLACAALGGIAVASMSSLRGAAGEAARDASVAIDLAYIDHSTELVEQFLSSAARRREVGGASLTPREAIQVNNELRFQVDSASRIAVLDSSPETAALIEGLQSQLVLFDSYIDSPNPSVLAGLSQLRDSNDVLIESLGPGFRKRSEERSNEAIAGSEAARLWILGASSCAVVLMGGTSLLVGRRLKRAIQRAAAETANLEVTTRVTQRRNDQFRALYQIVTEVGETLSMKYVVETTIREARALVGADVTALRLLRGDWLEVAGLSADVEADVHLAPVQLGSGVAGRVAKRGRSVLIDSDAELSMGPGEMILGVQAGVVVPLIVGARVVGTMSCWSRRPRLFTVDDQQILEMMASQVATAVAAADSHRVTEEMAHTDTLTELPNRRQLTKDTQERFDPALSSGRAVAVAMVDIDLFKRFNDEFGHKTGDITLQKVASVLRASLREEDHVYRYGGEEFILVIEDASAEEALRRVERARIAVERTPLTGDALQPVGPVTVSIGLAHEGAGTDFESLLKLADEALYQSKWEGRNRSTEWKPGLGTLPIAA